MSIIKGTNQIVAGFGGTKRSIGEVYFSQSSLATDNSGALPLFTGETIASANTIYPDFYNWVSAHTELQCTSEEYESALSTYGECPKYVIGNGSIRLPKLSNYIKAANTAEGITQKEAGLPTVKAISNTAASNVSGVASLPPYAKGVQNTQGYSLMTGSSISVSTALAYVENDASLDSSVYGASETVTPAHTTLYPWVVAYAAAIPASEAQAAEFQQGLSGKADTNLSNIPTNYDYVVESYSDEEGNWYRKYKSGWLEQGGLVTGTNTAQNVYTLVKPFTSTNYKVLVSAVGQNMTCWVGTKTTTTVVIQSSDKATFGVNWRAEGQGAN